MRGITIWRAALVAVAVLAMAGLALGQAQSGNIYGKVVADDGSSLPGATVTLSGGGAPQVFTTDNRGEFHFLNLAPGNMYALKVEMSGFGSVDQTGVAVNVGRNTEIRIAMRLTKVEAAVTVTGEAPLLDTRKVGTGATVNRQEMDLIPTARDPWVIAQTIPGVQIDRINVGGNQSGQQSIFVAKGSQTTQGSWNLDGVTVSDMASGASSPTYWDFDSFQELQAVTGGSDPSIATSGVTLNMVTKRGTNDVHGSARVFITDPAWQAHPTLNTEEQAQKAAGGGATAFLGNQITGVQDYGLEVGGPILRDRLWLWGSYGRQQIDLLTVSGFPDKTTLEDVNGKLNFQVISSNALTAFYLRGDKRKQGREASILRPPETSRDQKGPTALYKIEDSHVFSSNFFADVQYSYLDEGFQLVPEGGDKQAFQDSSAVWHNSYIFSFFKRPQHQAQGTSSYFFSTGSLGHEVKLGASYRDAPVANRSFWGGSGLIAFQAGSGACSIDCVAITRPSNRRVDVKYYAGYLSDTITADRLTISVGARYDWQKGDVQSSFAAGNPLYPNILPDAVASAIGGAVEWKDVSPRVGLTYALGPNRKTLARASYARYANQLGAFPVNQLSAIPGVAYAYYGWSDVNKNKVVDPGEIDFSNRIQTRNFDPNNPGSPVSPHHIDPNLKSEKTDEVVAGIGHEILPNFAVDVAYTYRHYKDFYVGYRSNAGELQNYVVDHTVSGTLPNGTPYSAPVYRIKGALPPGLFYTNRLDYTQEFNGLELTLNKRLSSGWMMRGSFAYNNTKQHVGPRACPDPNNTLWGSAIFNWEDSLPGSCEDNGIIAPNAGGGSGAFGQVNLNSRWQFNLSGAYQLPLGFTVAGNYYGRQGYPIAYYVIDSTSVATPPNDRSSRRVYVTAIDAFRYGWVSEFDMRLEKAIPITSTITATLAADMFNVLNLNTVLQRNARLNQSSKVTGTQTIQEMQAPRILRFSGRISF